MTQESAEQPDFARYGDLHWWRHWAADIARKHGQVYCVMATFDKLTGVHATSAMAPRDAALRALSTWGITPSTVPQ